MAPIAYCRACLVLVAMATTSDDRERLHALLDAWAPDGELNEKQALCYRCGRHGTVLYYEALPRPPESGA